LAARKKRWADPLGKIKGHFGKDYGEEAPSRLRSTNAGPQWLLKRHSVGEGALEKGGGGGKKKGRGIM